MLGSKDKLANVRCTIEALEKLKKAKTKEGKDKGVIDDIK